MARFANYTVSTFQLVFVLMLQESGRPPQMKSKYFAGKYLYYEVKI